MHANIEKWNAKNNLSTLVMSWHGF